MAYDLKKLMESKKGAPMDPMKKDAKMSMLQALRGEMSGMMKEDLQKPGLKKVTVASDKPEGLAKGLDTAKELISGAADEDSNSDQLGQDEADEHDVKQTGMFGVDPEMEEEAEEGDMEPGEEHEGEEHSEGGLSPEEQKMLELLMKKAGK